MIAGAILIEDSSRGHGISRSQLSIKGTLSKAKGFSTSVTVPPPFFGKSSSTAGFFICSGFLLRGQPGANWPANITLSCGLSLIANCFSAPTVGDKIDRSEEKIIGHGHVSGETVRLILTYQR